MHRAPLHAPQGRLLVIDDEKGSMGDVALRLVRLGVDVLLASEVDEAELLARQEGGAVCAALFSTDDCLGRVDAVHEAVGPHTGLGAAGLVVVGPRLTDEELAELRQRGLFWRLWSPFEDRDLRFLGRLLACRPDHDLRIEIRVPTALPGAAVRRGQRHEVLVGDLSPCGAYLETASPVPAGSLIQVEIDLPGGVVELRGMVRWVRPRAGAGSEVPKVTGFGVEFLRAQPVILAKVRDFLEGELERFRV